MVNILKSVKRRIFWGYRQEFCASGIKPKSLNASAIPKRSTGFTESVLSKNLEKTIKESITRQVNKIKNHSFGE